MCVVRWGDEMNENGIGLGYDGIIKEKKNENIYTH